MPIEKYDLKRIYPNTGRIINLLGITITLLSFYYLYLKLINFDLDVFTINFNFLTVILISITLITLTSLTLLMGYSWSIIMEFVTGEKINLRKSLPVFTESNLAKYLPGNIFHIVSRNLLGKKEGWSHWELALSTFIEVCIFLVIAALTLLPIFFFNLFGTTNSITNIFVYNIQNKYLITILLLLLILIISSLLLFSKLDGLHVFLDRYMGKNLLKLFIKIKTIFIFNFLVRGFLMVSLFHFLLNEQLDSVLFYKIIYCHTLAMILGNLTPGSPAGIGVREAVFVSLLENNITKETLIFSTLLLRFLAIISEIIAYIISRYIKSKTAISI